MTRCRRPLWLCGLSFALVLSWALVGGAGAVAQAPTWGPEQEVPPESSAHAQPLTVAFSDGTLVAVWTFYDDRPEDPPGVVLRSTRLPGGDWGDPVTFPVPDVGRVNAVVAGRDGGLEISYHDSSIDKKAEQVRTWHADGSLGDVTLTNHKSFDLKADAEGDVVATRLGRYRADGTYDRVVHYRGAGDWRRAPDITAHSRDVYVPGPGDSVWMAGYDTDRTRIRVQRWTPRMKSWKVDWSRDYARRPQYKSFVQGLDLALGGAGRAVLAFQQREVRDQGASVRVVRRKGRSGWSKPVVLDQLPAGKHRQAGVPVVAAAGDLGAVAWSSTNSDRAGRDVNLAWLDGGDVERRNLGVTKTSKGYHDVSLDVGLRADGDLLLTYLQRQGSGQQLVAWVGARNELEPTVLVPDASAMRGGSVFLAPGLAAVVSGASGGRLVSYAREG